MSQLWLIPSINHLHLKFLLSVRLMTGKIVLFHLFPTEGNRNVDKEVKREMKSLTNVNQKSATESGRIVAKGGIWDAPVRDRLLLCLSKQTVK